MRLATYQSPDGARSAILRTAVSPATETDDSELVDLNRFDERIPISLKEILESGTETLALVAEAEQHGTPLTGETVQLLPPVLNPQKIICVGLNYADHAAETGATVGDEPVIFNKFPTCLRGHQQPIELPAISSQVDYEAELVVVVGKTAKNVQPEQARDYIAGYCCGHDVSARDWQKGKPGKQWLLGKTFDSFAPLGPWLVTADEIQDPHNLGIKLRLNGTTMQDSNTSQLIFKIDFLISYLSQVCTLLPGDLIYTGTPPGVGMARNPPVFMQDGDEVEIEIEGLGTLRNSVTLA